jgi:hypothetical protein
MHLIFEKREYLTDRRQLHLWSQWNSQYSGVTSCLVRRGEEMLMWI